MSTAVSPERPIPPNSLQQATVAAVFCGCAGALYALAEVDPSPLVGMFLTVGPVIAVILWLQRDAARTGVGAVHDLGFLLWVGWPVVIPWYAFKTRGARGWRLMATLFVVIGASYIGWFVAALLVRVGVAGS